MSKRDYELDCACERWREWQLDCYLEDDDEYFDKEEEKERQDLIDKMVNHPFFENIWTREQISEYWSKERILEEIEDMDFAYEDYKENPEKYLKLNSENDNK